MLPIIAEHLGLEVGNKEGWLTGLCNSILTAASGTDIELHVAFPIAENTAAKGGEPPYGRINSRLFYYGFYEDINHAEKYDSSLEVSIGNIIKNTEPDVVHCFGTEFAHTLAAARACPDKKRLLISIQGVCSTIAECYMADIPEKVQKSVTFRDFIKKDSIKQQQQKYYLRGEREKEALALAGNVAGRTDFDKEYAYRCNLGIKYYNMNETLRPCFYEGRWSPDKHKSHTIFVSQGDYPLKGLHYLLAAAGELSDKYPDIEIRIAGNSLVNYHTLKDKIKISAYGKYLRRLIKENKLEGKVHFAGMLSAEEMKAEYLNCGVFVCCSSNENSPNSLGEAMILGVPCVAALVGGIPSLFESGTDGVGYKPDTKAIDNNYYGQVSAKLKDALYRMWDNPEEQYKYCENARNHANITHSPEKNYKKMIEIYADILNN
jgi:glycosyltransferase involved in cell wall biosynthesis